MTSSAVTPQSWAQSLLRELGAPVTPANVNAIVAWEAMEGGNWHNSARYNPLNTTYQLGGSSSMGGGSSVQAYSSWQQGLQATVNTLRSGLYGSILSALKTGNGLSGNIPGLSTWSAGGYSSISPAAGKGYGGGSGATIRTGAPGPTQSTTAAGQVVTGSDWTHLLLDIALLGLGGALLFKGGQRTLSTRSSRRAAA